MAEQQKHGQKQPQRSNQAPAAGPAEGGQRGPGAEEGRGTAQAAGPRLIRQEMDKLKASTEEEVDALRVNMKQEPPGSRDGSGPVVEELAAEKIGKFTEVGPYSGDRGAESVVPGRDNTSATLRKHHPTAGGARAEDVVEGNLDEPSDEAVMERKVDEGTAA